MCIKPTIFEFTLAALQQRGSIFRGLRIPY